MSNDNDSELLVQLLDGNLSGPVRSQLEARLKTDPALQTEWDELNLHRELLQQYRRRKKIGAIHAEMMAEINTASVRPARGTVFTYTMRVAAAVLLAILISVLYPYFSSTPEKLFAGRFEMYSPSTLRGGETGTVESEYRSGQWTKTVERYQAVSTKTPAESFFAGNAYLQLHDPSAAVTAFLGGLKANQSAGTHFFEQDTEYYLALAYLASGHPREALPLLTAIHAEPGHPYNEKVSWWFLQKVRRLAAR